MSIPLFHGAVFDWGIRMGGYELSNICTICMENVPAEMMFILKSCKCSFCRECLAKYIISILYNRVDVDCACPNYKCASNGKLTDSEIPLSELLTPPCRLTRHPEVLDQAEQNHCALKKLVLWCRNRMRPWQNPNSKSYPPLVTGLDLQAKSSDVRPSFKSTEDIRFGKPITNGQLNRTGGSLDRTTKVPQSYSSPDLFTIKTSTQPTDPRKRPSKSPLSRPPIRVTCPTCALEFCARCHLPWHGDSPLLCGLPHSTNISSKSKRSRKSNPVPTCLSGYRRAHKSFQFRANNPAPQTNHQTSASESAVQTLAGSDAFKLSQSATATDATASVTTVLNPPPPPSTTTILTTGSNSSPKQNSTPNPNAFNLPDQATKSNKSVMNKHHRRMRFKKFHRNGHQNRNLLGSDEQTNSPSKRNKNTNHTSSGGAGGDSANNDPTVANIDLSLLAVGFPPYSPDAWLKRCPACLVPIERIEGCAQMMCRSCKHSFCWYCLASLDDDFLLQHYDDGACKGKLGHSRASVIGHRVYVISVFTGLTILLLVAAPFIMIAVPCIICAKCHRVYHQHRLRKRHCEGIFVPENHGIPTNSSESDKHDPKPNDSTIPCYSVEQKADIHWSPWPVEPCPSSPPVPPNIHRSLSVPTQGSSAKTHTVTRAMSFSIP